VLTFLGISAPTARGQFTPSVFNTAPGVYLDVDGKVRCREMDASQQLAAMRARAKAAGTAAKDEKLAYVSLPKLLAQVKAAREAGVQPAESLRYLGGLTQIRYVFVFPEENDLVIAGPAEPWRVVRVPGDATELAVGMRSGRPVMQLDDLIVAMRTAYEGGGKLFGCGIYPSPDSLKISAEIERTMQRASRGERMKALAERMGPQEVRIFGTRSDTRFAFMCVAADYELKRFAMGLDRAPVAGVGNGVDNSRSAANKYWFEASFDPLLVSADGLSYGIRGQRLAVKAGGFEFDPRGATEKAQTFAAQFTKHLPELAASVPLFAELQNIADESILANLLRRDRLAEKIGWDNAWVFDDAAFPIAKVPTPKTADTLVSFTNGSIVAGGVILNFSAAVDPKSRQADSNDGLKAERDQLLKVRPDAKAGGEPIVSAK
jgi:hypothetical protein